VGGDPGVSAAGPGPAAAQQHPSPAAAWWALAVLVGLSVVSYVDRQIISLMVGPIRADLHVSDFQISLLQGIAFALFFATFGLPLGWLVDRTQRRLVVFGGVMVWSLATAASGLATGFGQLFLARLMVGAGEAALAPAAYSMIADLFPKRRLALALAIFAIGGSAGSALAVFLGGMLISGLSQVSLALGSGAPLATWQLAYLSVGLPGFVLAFLIFLIREPARSQVASKTSAADMAEFWAFVRSRRAFLACHFLGFGCMSALGYAAMNWLPAYLMRRFGVPVAEAGALVGFIIVCSIPGALLAGALADRLFARGRPDAHLLLYVVIALALAVVGPAAFLAPTLAASVALTAGVMFLAAAPGTATAALQIATPPRLRGRASALYLFVYQLIGLGLGPTAVAAFTDYVFKDDALVGRSVAAAIAIFGLIAALLFALGRRPMRRAIQALAEEEEASATQGHGSATRASRKPTLDPASSLATADDAT
jgi:MFS family permease